MRNRLRCSVQLIIMIIKLNTMLDWINNTVCIGVIMSVLSQIGVTGLVNAWVTLCPVRCYMVLFC